VPEDVEGSPANCIPANHGNKKQFLRSDERLISHGSVPVFVIPTNEELQIAQKTAARLNPTSGKA
jgi:acetate kinase